MQRTGRKNMVGQRYGLLVGINYQFTQYRRAYWLFQCDCGKTAVLQGKNVRTGNTSSCGCKGLPPKQDGKKRCTRCDVFFPLTDFHKWVHGADGLANYCKDCARVHKRDRELITKYGVNRDWLTTKTAAQKDTCAICNKPNGKRPLHIDHDHTTGQIRDLLCRKCNMGIGLFNDNPALMSKAISYLEKHGGQLQPPWTFVA